MAIQAARLAHGRLGGWCRQACRPQRPFLAALHALLHASGISQPLTLPQESVMKAHHSPVLVEHEGEPVPTGEPIVLQKGGCRPGSAQ